MVGVELAVEHLQGQRRAEGEGLGLSFSLYRNFRLQALGQL